MSTVERINGFLWLDAKIDMRKAEDEKFISGVLEKIVMRVFKEYYIKEYYEWFLENRHICKACIFTL